MAVLNAIAQLDQFLSVPSLGAGICCIAACLPSIFLTFMLYLIVIHKLLDFFIHCVTFSFPICLSSSHPISAGEYLCLIDVNSRTTGNETSVVESLYQIGNLGHERDITYKTIARSCHV